MIRNLFFATIISVFGLLLSPVIIIAQQPGDTLWTRVYGYSGSDDGFSVRQTDDLGYIITGLTGNYPDFDIWLLKTDQYGDTLWTRTYGGNLAEYGYSVQPASDGGYIISGTTQSYGMIYIWLKPMQMGMPYGRAITVPTIRNMECRCCIRLMTVI
jgi:hypothetical protein